MESLSNKSLVDHRVAKGYAHGLISSEIILPRDKGPCRSGVCLGNGVGKREIVKEYVVAKGHTHGGTQFYILRPLASVEKASTRQGIVSEWSTLGGVHVSGRLLRNRLLQRGTHSVESTQFYFLWNNLAKRQGTVLEAQRSWIMGYVNGRLPRNTL